MLKVVYNAVNIAPGGGLNGTLGYLQAWQEIGAKFDLTLYASRPSVLDAAKAVRPDIEVIPFAHDLRPALHTLAQQLWLGPAIEKMHADVVLTTQSTVGRCRVPQIVHHRNLGRFLGLTCWERLRRREFVYLGRDCLSRIAIRKAVYNVFISDYMRQEAKRLFPESAARSHVIYNGLSQQLLAGSKRTEPGWSGRPHLMALQSILQHKNNEGLIRVLKRLTELAPDLRWEMTITGGGDWTFLQRYIARLGLADRVRFPGYLSHDEIDPIMRDSVCLVFPSYMEGFGNPPVEAMARHCPVVASNVTAMPEVIGDAGILCNPDRPEEFAQAVLRIYHDRALRQDLVNRGLKRIQRFRWTRSAEKMAELLESCAA